MSKTSHTLIYRVLYINVKHANPNWPRRHRQKSAMRISNLQKCRRRYDRTGLYLDSRQHGKTDLGFASDAGYSQLATARSRAAYKGQSDDPPVRGARPASGA